MGFAWVIERDYTDGDWLRDLVGASGPANAPEWLVRYVQYPNDARYRDPAQRRGAVIHQFHLEDAEG